MALFGGLLGGSEDDDPYKDILTPAQRREMQSQGLLAWAAAMGEASQPSWLPVSLGSALGKAGGALGAGQQAGMTAALQNALRAQQVRKLRSEEATGAKLDKVIEDAFKALEAWEKGGRQGPPPIPPAAGGGGAGAAPAAGEGGLLSPDFALPDYGNALPAAAPAALPSYPAQTGTTRFGGGGLLGGGFDAGLGTETPSSAYAPGGALDPFAASTRRGLTGAAGGAAPAVPAAPAAGAGVATPQEREAWYQHRESGGQDTIQQFVMKARLGPGSGGGLLGPGFGGGSDAADLGAGGDEPVAAAPGGGLLALAQDLRAPVEADPFRRVDAVLGQIRGRESASFANPYALTPQQNVAYPRSHASGAYQFQPGTWRQWTEASGYGTQYPEAYQAPPQVQDAVARYAALHGDVNATNLWGASSVDRGLSPYSSPFEGGGGPPDEVIPTGGTGTRPPVMQAQYAPGGAPLPAPGTLPRLPALGAAQPLGAGGVIPGLNISPQKLAIIDAMAARAGLGNPFKGLIDTYYKSPGYLGDIERQKKQIDLEFAGPLAEEQARVDLKYAGPKASAVAEAQLESELTKIFGKTRAELEQNLDTPVRVEERDLRGNTTVRWATPRELRTEYGARGGTPLQTGLSETQKAFAPIIAKQFGEQQTAAQAAAQEIKINNESLRLLDKGIYTGWDANLGLALGRIFGVSGKDPADQVKNTQLYVLQRMQQAAQAVRAQPGSASDKDVAFANRMSVGDISLDAATIREGLEIYNRFNRERIRDHNRNAEQLDRSVTGGIKLTVEEPPAYERRQGNTPGGNTWTRP